MVDQRYKAALLFGAPGVGKGTQGAILGAVPGFHHFSMGDAFRMLDDESQIGRTVREYSSRGELVPDDITTELWRQSVKERVDREQYDPRTDLLLLDGVPRNPEQARLLDDKIEVLAVVHLTTSNKDALFDRLRKRALEQGRDDDAKIEVIQRRWEIYQEDTQPVLAHYSDGLVHDLDAIGSPGEVLLKILQVLAPLQAKAFANALG